MSEPLFYRDPQGVMRQSRYVLCSVCGKVVMTGQHHRHEDGTMGVVMDASEKLSLEGVPITMDQRFLPMADLVDQLRRAAATWFKNSDLLLLEELIRRVNILLANQKEERVDE